MLTPVTDIEERQAWDQYVAALWSRFGETDRPGEGPEYVARIADTILSERRKRYPRGAP
jgi:hypothetical protein